MPPGFSTSFLSLVTRPFDGSRLGIVKEYLTVAFSVFLCDIVYLTTHFLMLSVRDRKLAFYF